MSDPDTRPETPWPPDLLARPWMCSALVATPHAAARLWRWVDAGGLARPDTPESRAALAFRVDVLCEDGLRGLVQAALVKLPGPLLEHLVANVTLFVVGLNVRGWCTRRRRLERQTEARQLVVVCFRPSAVPSAFSPNEEFMGYIGHEVAHCWVLKPGPLDAPPRTEAELREEEDRHKGHLALSVEWCAMPQLFARPENQERQAAALAAHWGFVGPGADGASCAGYVRSALGAEAARAWAESPWIHEATAPGTVQ